MEREAIIQNSTFWSSGQPQIFWQGNEPCRKDLGGELRPITWIERVARELLNPPAEAQKNLANNIAQPLEPKMAGLTDLWEAKRYITGEETCPTVFRLQELHLLFNNFLVYAPKEEPIAPNALFGRPSISHADIRKSKKGCEQLIQTYTPSPLTRFNNLLTLADKGLEECAHHLVLARDGLTDIEYQERLEQERITLLSFQQKCLTELHEFVRDNHLGSKEGIVQAEEESLNEPEQKIAEFWRKVYHPKPAAK